MHKPVAIVTLEGDAEEILLFAQRLRSLNLRNATLRCVVKSESGRGYQDYVLNGIREGSPEFTLANIGQLEKQGRLTREQGDELAELIRGFAKLQE